MGQLVAFREPEPVQPVETFPSSVTSTEHNIRLADVFRPSCIKVVPARVGKSSMLSLLVSLLVRIGKVPRDQAETIVEALLERERSGTTAIGNGLALPHLRTTAVQHPVGAVAILPHGINFHVPYGMPTRLVLLVLSPENGRQDHVELMERLVSLAKDETLNDFITPELTPTQLHEYFCMRDSL